MSKPNVFVAEVPRVFAEIKAADESAGREELKKIMNDVIDNYAKFEEVTGIPIPTPEEARLRQDAYSKSLDLFSTGKTLASTVGGTLFLGVHGADILFNTSLCNTLGIDYEKEDHGSSGFLSLGRLFTKYYAKEENEPKKSFFEGLNKKEEASA